MLLVAGGVRETLPTKVTIQWLFAIVRLQVTFKVAQLVELSFTYAALVRLLSRM